MMASQTLCERRSENGPKRCQYFHCQRLSSTIASAVHPPAFLIQTIILHRNQQRLAMAEGGVKLEKKDPGLMHAFSPATEVEKATRALPCSAQLSKLLIFQFYHWKCKNNEGKLNSADSTWKTFRDFCQRFKKLLSLYWKRVQFCDGTKASSWSTSLLFDLILYKCEWLLKVNYIFRMNTKMFN